MAAAAGIFNHAMTAGQALTGKAVTPMAGSTIRNERLKQFERHKQQIQPLFRPMIF